MSASHHRAAAPLDPRLQDTGGRPPDRKRSPTTRIADIPQTLPDEDVLEPAAGGFAPNLFHEDPNLFRRQFSQQEWEYLESLPPGSLAEEIKLMRVLSLRLVQQGLQAEDPADEVRYYSEATRIMARLPALLKAEQALQSSQDDVTQAMIEAINTVLEEIEAEKASQLELPFNQSEV